MSIQINLTFLTYLIGLGKTILHNWMNLSAGAANFVRNLLKIKLSWVHNYNLNVNGLTKMITKYLHIAI